MTKRASKKLSNPILDFSYGRAAQILARQPGDGGRVTLYLVGCGGTGSWMALGVSRLLLALRERNVPARAFFYDHDAVERKNVGRQLFSASDIGHNKAELLAFRFGSWWGLDVAAVPVRFKAEAVEREREDLVVLVGCVDNAAGRAQMHKCLAANEAGKPPSVWWVDCGNHDYAGQVLVGTAQTAAALAGAFPSETVCAALPSPALQRPELLVARPEERAKTKLSCAELAAANVQSFDINFAVAAAAANVLTGLLVTRRLKHFAHELNLTAGSARSTYATPEEVARVIGKPVGFVLDEKARAA